MLSVEVRLAQVSVGYFYGADLQGPGAPHDACLDGHPSHYGQVWVHRRVGLLPKIFTDQPPDPWNPGGTSDQDDLVHLLLPKVALGQHRLDGVQNLPEEIGIELLEQLAGDDGLEKHWSFSGALGNLQALGGIQVEGYLELDARLQGEVEFGRFHSLSEAVDVLFEGGGEAILLLDLFHGVLEEPLAEVLAS